MDSGIFTGLCQLIFIPVRNRHYRLHEEMKGNTNNPEVIGWREWVALPALGLGHIKVKVDTGARTSSLHAYFVEPFKKARRTWVRFGVHPYQRDRRTAVICEAAVIDQRWVTDSGGHREKRYVIATDLQLGVHHFPVELTLTNRDTMLFRMLLGRIALRKRFIIDPARSYVLGRHMKRARSK